MKDLDYEGADVCILVYCIDKESTFEQMDTCMEDIKANCNPPPMFILVGNKVDLDRAGQRQVKTEDAMAKKEESNFMHFVETNAHD